MNRHRRHARNFTRQLIIPGIIAPTPAPTVAPLIYTDLTYRELRRECQGRHVVYWNLTKAQMIDALANVDTTNYANGVLV